MLLISLDTLRADHLHCYGYPRPVSPQIDRFAERCVRFEHAYSHSPWTTPSHAALFTALYPSVLGLKRYPETGRIADRVETMAEFFQAHGYRTHAVTEGGMVHAQFGFDQGFEKYFQSARHVDHGVEEALQWLQANGNERFFFFYHTYDIHRYNPPEEFRKQFVRGAPGRLKDEAELALKIQHFENEAFVERLDEEELRYIVGLYDASIAWVDRYVGLLLEDLERRGLMEKTIVVITSDHGEEFMERGRTGHGYTNYEEQLRVPVIIHHPDAEPGVRKTMFRHIDLLPTLAEALGLPRRTEWLGESIYPCLLEGDPAPPARERFNFAEAGHSNYRSIQSVQWKLIFSHSPQVTRLYDLVADPGERVDVMVKYERVGRQLDGLREKIEETNRLLAPSFAGEGPKRSDLPEDLLEQLRSLGYAE